MDKKGMALKEGVYLFLGSIFIFFSISLLFGDTILETVQDTIENIFDVDMSKTTRISHQSRSDSLNAFSSFISDIRKTADSQKDFCIAPIETIRSDFFNNDLFIVLSQNNSGTKIQLFEEFEDGGRGNDHDLSRRRPVVPAVNIPSMNPCVVRHEINLQSLFRTFFSGNMYDGYLSQIISFNNQNSAVNRITLNSHRRFDYIDGQLEKGSINFHNNFLNEYIYILKAEDNLCFIKTSRSTRNSCVQMPGSSGISANCFDYEPRRPDSGTLRNFLKENQDYICHEDFIYRITGDINNGN